MKKRITFVTVLALSSLTVFQMYQQYYPDVMMVNGEEVAYDHELIRALDNRHDKTPNFARNEESDFDIELELGGKPVTFGVYDRERYVLIAVSRDGKEGYIEAKDTEKAQERLEQYTEKQPEQKKG